MVVLVVGVDRTGPESVSGLVSGRAVVVMGWAVLDCPRCYIPSTHSTDEETFYFGQTSGPGDLTYTDDEGTSQSK